MSIEQAINALIMCQELMLFDPATGETHELWQENKDNQDLYNACTMAIEALSQKIQLENGKRNYDRIRNMSVEKMAKWLFEFSAVIRIWDKKRFKKYLESEATNG